MTVAGPSSVAQSLSLEIPTVWKAPEVHSGSYSIPAATVFSLGMLVIEVRPMYPAIYSVGEMDDLSSA